MQYIIAAKQPPKQADIQTLLFIHEVFPAIHHSSW